MLDCVCLVSAAGPLSATVLLKQAINNAKPSQTIVLFVYGIASFHCIQWCIRFSSRASLVLIHAFTSVWKGNELKVSRSAVIEQTD